ncbi:cysteine hydrolase [Rhodococcus opacus]|uniref:cysteine hydrolase n=1 Tax=Rhodococcus opacus TaxID=37919 RepID=UPI001C442CDA|nr:cysteine hydrolase [Rhodococcus opacus]MBV6756213.1 cysteine hydrolase [Rhodococcus opacus]
MKGLEPGKRPALLISECQNLITNDAYSDSPLIRQVVERQIISKINELAAQFRVRDLPVVHCIIAARPGFEGFRINCVLAAQLKKVGRLVAGTPDAAIHDGITVGVKDIVAQRYHGMAPFSGTDLDAILRGLDVDTVVLAGVSTNIALPGAATEAIARGYDVILVEDCTAGGTAETHQMQVVMHLPLLSTITDGASISRWVEAGTEVNGLRSTAPTEVPAG